MIYKDNVGLVNWCKQKAATKAGYVYGTYFGMIVTKALVDAKAKQYPALYTPAYILASYKWIGKEAGDCVGLIKGYYWYDPMVNRVVKGLDGRPDTSANGMHNYAKTMNGKTSTQNLGVTWGKLATIPEKAGVLVWRDGHIGVYIGNGLVIESRGVAYGVVITSLSTRGWVDWCLCAFISYAEGENEAMLYKGCPDGEPVKEWQESLIKVDATALPEYGADGDFGTETETWTNAFKKSVGLPEDGKVDELTYGKMLNALQNMTSGITQEELDAANHRADVAEAEVKTLEEELRKADVVIIDQKKTITANDAEMTDVASSLDDIEAFRQRH